MRRSGLLWGVILFLVGALLLLNNLGIVAVRVWGAVWAVVLIALGLGILWGISFGWGQPAGEEVSIPLERAASARIRVKHGAGRLRVSGGTAPDALVEGTFGGSLNYRTRRTGDKLDVEMSLGSFPHMLAPWNWGRGGFGWTFRVNDDVLLALAFETGASDVRLDLSELLVSDLRIDTGASSLNLTLPTSAGQSHARIDAGAAAVSIHVPPEVAARVRFKGGLASISVDLGRFPRTGGIYQSPDYEGAENRVDIEIEAGVGSVSVR